MKTITIQSIKTEGHPETKGIFWFVFAGSKGGTNRIRIISHLREIPSNTHQIAKHLGLDYKLIQHHLRILEQHNLVTKFGNMYGATYLPSVLFEDGETVFDEIVAKLNKKDDNKW